ncbi:MAG TPA: putative Fe-S cluster assembly protein SufT [Thermoanaerobaculia bacterium]|nr:putative Fe-S cluster assembly protein SufT [Thermoanaerobaculia bacterium]
MQTRETVTLLRDTEAVQVPEGAPFTLTAGTSVVITQSLGGTYTVMTPYGLLARIDERNADALGKEAGAAEAPETVEAPLEERVWAAMKKCYDPEIPVNIVDLGLVYDCQVAPREDGLSDVTVKMTLTAPGCGMGDVLAQDVKRRVEELAGVGEADIELVFDPQWSMEMMTEAARLQLGML